MFIIYIYNKQKSLYENHIRKIIKLHIIEKYLIRNEKKRTLININRIVSLLNSRFYLFTKWNIAYYKKSDNLLENRILYLKKSKLYENIKKIIITKLLDQLIVGNYILTSGLELICLWIRFKIYYLRS